MRRGCGQMAKRRKKVKPYHYTECGLNNIYLVNGFEFVETPRGAAIVLTDVDGLHNAIGDMLVEKRKNLTGAEFRFLRHELGMTQLSLATVLGVDVQSVARWEKGQTKGPIDRPAQSILRLLYKEFRNDNRKITDILRELAELDEKLHEPDGWLEFNETNRVWETVEFPEKPELLAEQST